MGHGLEFATHGGPRNREHHAMTTDFDFDFDSGPAPAPMFGQSAAPTRDEHLTQLTGAVPTKAEAAATLRELHDEYAQKLYAYTLSVLRSPQDAEDAVQTTF